RGRRRRRGCPGTGPTMAGVMGAQMDIAPHLSGTRTRRQSLMGAAISAVSGPLAACGGVRQATPTVSTAAVAISGTIEVWHGWDLRVNEVRALCVQFELAHPGVRVSAVQSSSVGSQKVTAAVLAGTPPDLLDVGTAMYALFVPAKALVDLKTYLTRDKIDPK